MQKKILLWFLFITYPTIYAMEKQNKEQEELLIKAQSALNVIGDKLMTTSFALCHTKINDPVFIENPYLYGTIKYEKGNTIEINDFYALVFLLDKNSLLYKFCTLPLTGQLLFLDVTIKDIHYMFYNNQLNQYTVKLIGDNDNTEEISFAAKLSNKECAYCKKNILSMYSDNLNAARLYIINFDLLKKLFNYSLITLDDNCENNTLIKYLFYTGSILQKKIDKNDISFDKKFNIISFFRKAREKTTEIYNENLGNIMSLMIFNNYIKKFINHNSLELKADLYY